MTHTEDPIIVRREQRPNGAPISTKPGIHSYNVNRRAVKTSARTKSLRFLQTLFIVIGICGVGYYGYALVNQYVYQAYENWAFDQQIAGRAEVTFSDYLREQTPFGFLVGTVETKTAIVASKPSAPSIPMEHPRPSAGSVLGRVSIKSLSLTAIVKEGVDDATLRTAVGHVPSTALAGEEGNFAIAAHRDTLFRALKDIHEDDLVTFESPGAMYTYRVKATKIVKPSDVSVLKADGGGLIPADAGQAPRKLLTMITCYPFYYVGSAPKRFIVEARLVSDGQGANTTVQVPVPDKPAPALAAAARLHRKRRF